MKKLFVLVALAFMAVTANAQAVIVDIDWTERSEYLDLWYSDDYATVTVEQGTGLIIENSSDGTTEYWEPQVPVIGHIPVIDEGGQYQLKFTVDAPAAGEIRLDFCSWDGTADATFAQVINVEAGENEYTVDFLDYPTTCTDAMIFYQCGKIPGKHIIKNVRVIDWGAVTTGIDWTQRSGYPDLWYDGEHAEVSVTSEGLIINSNPPANAEYWEPQVPMIGHIPVIAEGGQYRVKFTVDAPAAGELRLDFCSWDGSSATFAQVINVEAGEKEYTVDFLDYPTACTDAMIFYQSGKIPGKHIIKDVRVIDLGAVTAEIDWTERSEYLDLWYSDDYATVTVEQGTGLIIDCTSDGTTNYWEPQVPMIGHIPVIDEGGQYRVQFTVDAPAAGEIRLDFCSWDGSDATFAQVINVEAGEKEYTVDFLDYPTACTDAMIFYQCGKIPGKHIIKNVRVIWASTAGIDWTQCSGYPDLWFDGEHAEVSVTSEGLIINSNPPANAEYWEPQVPMIGHIPEIDEGGKYRVRFTVDAPEAGEIRLDFCSWDGSDATFAQVINVEAGEKEYTVDFLDYPTACTDAMIFYQCGKIPGKHIIKNVRVTTLPADLTYNYNAKDKTAEVIRNPNYIGNIFIPETVSYLGEEYTVTKISDTAFADCTKLTSVTIPATVTELRGYSFSNCTELRQITVDPSNSVYDSRNNCNAIIEKATNTLLVGCQTTVIPEDVTAIGNDAFWGRWGMEKMPIPESVTSIGSCAFAYCISLESITLPSALERIEGSAFTNSALKNIILPASLTSLGQEAFRECENLESVVIGNGLEEIPDNCFKGCKSLVTVNFGKVKKIGWDAFNSTGLTNLVLPATVKEVGDGAFGCSPISTLDLGQVEKIGAGAFMSTGVEELYVPATLTELGIEGFSWNFTMKKVTFQEGCTKVFDTMFHGNGNLSEVVLPNTITEIQARAFRECKSLSTLAWPEKLETIGEQAFQESGITSAVLPISMKWIDGEAFNNCQELVDVDIVYIEHLGYGAFSDCPKIKKICLPSTIVLDENSWGAFANDTGIEEVEFFEGTTIINDMAFTGCEKLKSLPYGLPSTLTRIGGDAFMNCKSLEDIVIPKNVTWIQENAFNGCESLVNVTSKILDPTKVEFENDVFTGIAKTAVLYIPKGTYSAYNEKGWTKYFASVVEEPDNALYPSDLATRAGKQPTLGIAMDNESQITALQFDLVLPEGVTVANDEDGMLISLSTRALKTHTIAKSVQKDGSIRIICSSNNNAVFSGNEGSVVLVKLDISKDLADGEYTVAVNNIELSSSDGIAFHPENAKATITVGGVIAGDVDNNGSVTVNDAVCIVRDILGLSNKTFVKAAADLDGNGSVTINDKVVLINRFILGKNKARTRGGDEVADNSTLTIDDLTMKPGETRTINVLMTTDRTDIEALQCDIYLPDGLEFVASEENGEKYYADKGGRATTSHSVVSSIQEDGALRVVESCDDGNTFLNNDKPVFTFKVKASNDINIGNYTIRLANMELSYGEPINPDDSSCKVNIVEMGETVEITIGKNSKTTFCGDKGLDFSGTDDVKAFIATGFDKAEGTIWMTRVKDVPAGVPVMIKGKANETYNIPVTDGGTSHYENMFVGNTTGGTITINETSEDGTLTNYYMSGGQFVSVSKSAKIGNNKCYLQLPTNLEASTTGEALSVKIADSGKSSFAAPYDLDFTDFGDELKAFTATGYDASTTTVWLTRVKKVQKGEGLMLKGKGGETYTIPSTGIQATYENMIKGNISGETMEIGETSEDGTLTNFYLKGGTYMSVKGYTKIGNNKSYLQLPTAMLAGARSEDAADMQSEYTFAELETESMPIIFASIGDGDGETTGIQTMYDDSSNDEWYTLGGQRISKPTKKGLYIHNGHKVVIK
jgi:hypothetical protein